MTYYRKEFALVRTMLFYVNKLQRNKPFNVIFIPLASNNY